MIDLFETALHLQTFCDQQGWQSCFIGGIAVHRRASRASPAMSI
jgi:hypothetical protein